jgi:hypothetical protein
LHPVVSLLKYEVKEEQTMKFLLSLAVAILILTVFSMPAIAQQDTGGGPAPAVQQRPAKELTPEQFTALKARILKMIEVRRAKLDEAKVCVESATTQLELRKCRKQHPMGPDGPRHRMHDRQPQEAPTGQQQ